MTTWRHTDDVGLFERSSDALARARDRDWATDTTAVRAAELRALIVRAHAAAAGLSSTPPVFGGDTIQLNLPNEATYATPNHAHMASALREVWGAWAPADLPPMGRLTTIAGRAPESGESADAGAWPAIVSVAVVIGVTVAVAYVASIAGQIVDNQLAREEQSQQLADNAAEVVQIAEDHTAAEVAAGKSLPMNEVQRAAISTLRETAKVVAERTTPPIVTPSLPGFGVEWLIPLLVLGVGGYFLLKE